MITSIRIGSSLKVKINKECLFNAIKSSSSSSHLVQVWKNKVFKNSSLPTSSNLTSSSSSMGRFLSIGTWNCRGIHTSTPYINKLLCDNEILVIQEHWLWPYESDFLQDINKDYSSFSVFDARLNAESTLQRGCGGVSILWKKGLKVSPISTLSSDRICGINLSLDNNIVLSILGIYMPSSDQSIENYTEYLNDVDLFFSSLTSNDPVILVGDLNCHLGHLGGSRCIDVPNRRGILWKYLLDKHSLFVASLGSLSSGPTHTYSSGGHSTTIDYIIGNTALAELLLSCKTLNDDPLNTSDHLPILAKLVFQQQLLLDDMSVKPPRLNWDLASNDGLYSAQVDEFVKPFLGNDYSSIAEIESDLLIASEALVSISCSTIPIKHLNRSLGKRHIKDAFLSNLCWKSRVAFREWKEAGRPLSGLVYEKRKECKRKVSEYISKCRGRLERKSIQRRDEMFKKNHPQRFKSKSPRTQGTNISVDGTRVSDLPSVLDLWADHFSELGESRCSSNPNLDTYVSNLNDLDNKSFMVHDSVLDCPITPEEVFQAINHLKAKSTGGADQLSPNHLKHSGPLFKEWLCLIFNNIVSLEKIPSSFKFGLITPAKGTDSWKLSRYHTFLSIVEDFRICTS